MVKVTNEHMDAHTHTRTYLYTHTAILRDNWVIGGELPSQHPVTIKASSTSAKLREVKEQRGGFYIDITLFPLGGERTNIRQLVR